MWSCSRSQIQAEKICKSQCTNQCHSLRTYYWFVLRNMQLFSGCVCYLEQLHAQSPFLYPIVFGSNLIPFFRYWLSTCCPFTALFGYVPLKFTWAPARSQLLLFVVLAAWLWCFTAGCYVKSPLFSQPRSFSNRSVIHDGRKRKTMVYFKIQRCPRINTAYKLLLFAIGCRRWPCIPVQVSVVPRLSTATHNLKPKRHWN